MRRFWSALRCNIMGFCARPASGGTCTIVSGPSGSDLVIVSASGKDSGIITLDGSLGWGDGNVLGIRCAGDEPLWMPLGCPPLKVRSKTSSHDERESLSSVAWCYCI